MARIEQVLDECIDRLRRGESIERCLASHPEHAAELGPLLRMAAAVGRASAIEPRPEFKARLKYQALSALQSAGEKKRHGLFGGLARARTWATVAVGVLVLVLAGGGTVIASTNSLPGEPLYGVKTTVERVQLALTPSKVEKAKLLAKFADRRVNEIVSLVTQGKGERVDQTSVALARDLNRIGETLSSPAAVKGEAGLLGGEAAAPPQAYPTQTPEPPSVAVAAPGERGGEDDGRAEVKAARSPTEVREALRKEALRHQAALEKLLEKAEEKDKPAIRRAILRAAQAYQAAIEEGDGPRGEPGKP
ncbi:MAG: DUF5667 domain-containing protein [Chloroflexota bacterium]